jgi:hypothetical protein
MMTRILWGVVVATTLGLSGVAEAQPAAPALQTPVSAAPPDSVTAPVYPPLVSPRHALPTVEMTQPILPNPAGCTQPGTPPGMISPAQGVARTPCR